MTTSQITLVTFFDTLITSFINHTFDGDLDKVIEELVALEADEDLCSDILDAVGDHLSADDLRNFAIAFEQADLVDAERTGYALDYADELDLSHD